jgi:phosphatidylserine decarboxylase
VDEGRVEGRCGLDALRDLFVPIHRDGHKFVGAGIAATLLFLLLWPALAWIALILTGCLAFFFRDPARVTPTRPGLVLAPADGRIVGIGSVKPPQELGFGPVPRTRISICLSILDVHVNRAPVSGEVVRSVYVPGAFYSARLDQASEDNERHALIIAAASTAELAVVQIAGLLSRRIVTYAGEGDTLAAGQRFGLIRFGSRVDVYLPAGTSALVCVGQRAIAGETVLADIDTTEGPREGRRQ